MIPTEARTSRLYFTSNQRRGFLAAWGGVVLDGVDSFIYALVLVPALRAILPTSGIEPTVGNVSFYGSILFSVFLIGWGLAFLWGPLADRFGRVRVLMLAILCYSLFTFLGALAQNWWQLAIFRLFAGFGIGGEFVGAGTFVVEELPESPMVGIDSSYQLAFVKPERQPVISLSRTGLPRRLVTRHHRGQPIRIRDNVSIDRFVEREQTGLVSE